MKEYIATGLALLTLGCGTSIRNTNSLPEPENCQIIVRPPPDYHGGIIHPDTVCYERQELTTNTVNLSDLLQ